MSVKSFVMAADIDGVTLEINAGDKLAVKFRPYRIAFLLGGDAHEVTTGDTLTIRCPDAFTLEEVRASVKTAGGVLIFDIKKNGTTILSTPLTIDASEKTSLTAAVPAVISTSAIAQDNELEVSVTDDGGGNAFGAFVILMGKIELT